MSIFHHFQRKPFLSQVLLGILAIFALPEIQVKHECEQTIINQPLIQTITAEYEQEQHALFFAEIKPENHPSLLKAVKFTPFFAKAFHFDGDLNHPIRAGPFLFITSFFINQTQQTKG